MICHFAFLSLIFNLLELLNFFTNEPNILVEDDWGKLLDGDISVSSYWKDADALGEMVRWLEIVGCPVCGERDPVIRLIECSLGSKGPSCKVFCQRCGREFHVQELEKTSNIEIREVTCPCCYQSQMDNP